MSCAEAMRRCPTAIFVRQRHSVYRRLLAGCPVARARGRADGRAGRHRQGLSRPRGGRARLRRRTRARRVGAGRRPCPHETLVLARGRQLEGRGEDRIGPSQAGRPDGGPTRPRGDLPGAVPDPAAARAWARAPRSGSFAAGIETIGALAELDDDELRDARARGKVGRAAARPRARHRPAPPRGLDGANLDLEARRPSRATSATPSGCTTSCARMALTSRRVSAGPRPERTDGDDKASLSRLRDPHALDLASGGHR